MQDPTSRYESERINGQKSHVSIEVEQIEEEKDYRYESQKWLASTLNLMTLN